MQLYLFESVFKFLKKRENIKKRGSFTGRGDGQEGEDGIE